MVLQIKICKFLSRKKIKIMVLVFGTVKILVSRLKFWLITVKIRQTFDFLRSKCVKNSVYGFTDQNW